MERSDHQAHVICLGNQKGGVGKTTTCVQLAAAFAERGARCLIVDLDMTAGATKLLRAPTQGWTDSFDLLTGAESAFDVVIDNTDPEVELPLNLHLVPGSARLRDLDQLRRALVALVPAGNHSLYKPIAVVAQ